MQTEPVNIVAFLAIYVVIGVFAFFALVVLLRWALGTSEIIKELKKQTASIESTARDIHLIVTSKKNTQ